MSYTIEKTKIDDVIFWLDPADSNRLFSSSYWNDENEERKKEWWLDDPSDPKLKNYLIENKLWDEFYMVTDHLQKHGLLHGKILDIAAGVCWTTALLSKFSAITSADALEFSRHRLEFLAPNVIQNLEGKNEKIRRIFGSFYDLKSQSETYDIVWMSQAFHHADKPLNLLVECDRVLKKDGIIVLTGEQYVHPLQYVRRVIGRFIRSGKITSNFRKLFPPEAVGGDHYYKLRDYRFLFESMDYSLIQLNTFQRGGIALIAQKNKGNKNV